MKKDKEIYVCEKCGYESPKWFGRCPICGTWDSAVKVKMGKGSASPLPSLMKLETHTAPIKKISVGFFCLDEALCGGIAPGQVIILGGEPGVGKSTLALEIASSLASKSLKVLYASGEESYEQIASRADRIGASGGITIMTDQDVEAVLRVASSADLLILDSIQTFYAVGLDSPPGSVSQVREVTRRIVDFSKKEKIPAILIAHVTKSGDIAGPKVIEHMVDTVLYFEGERITDYRILRVFKNRFGPSGEVVIFEMRSEGLIPVETPVFVDEELPFGNAVACVIEGVRPFIIQVQALVSRSKMPSPRRTAIGVDPTRVSAIIAVMSKLLKIPLDLHEIYVKILGGMKISDPGVDLAVAAAILSSFMESEVGRVVFMGEVGLDGKIRAPYAMMRRVDIVKRAGFETVASPVRVEGLEGKIIRHISDLMEIVG